jgi:hypothetical protein
MTGGLILGMLLGVMLAPWGLMLMDEIGWRRRGYKKWPWK